MLNRVQKQLTFINTIMTGGILLLLLTVLFYWNLRMREEADRTAFENLWSTVYTQLQTSSTLSTTYLAQAETSNRAIIQIQENGLPFFFPGSWLPESSRSSLIESALQSATEQNVFPAVRPVSASVIQTDLMQVEGSGEDSYYGRLAVISTGKGVKSLLILSYITPRRSILLQLLPLYGGIAVFGVLALYLCSLYLTHRALLPAREAADKQSAFIAAASHELRSPLAVIRSCCSAARSECPGEMPTPEDTQQPDGSRMAGLLANIDRECSRMARLVSDMLLLASTDAKNWTLSKEEVEADTLMIETYESFLPVCREKGLSLSLRLPDEVMDLKLFADRQRLEQILTILMDNAVSYTPKGKEISLMLSKQKADRFVFEVADRGPGIPDEQKEQVFERFYRSDSARNDKKHFGLGLSIAKELAELHGGTIRVLDGRDGGSRFVVTIPS